VMCRDMSDSEGPSLEGPSLFWLVVASFVIAVAVVAALLGIQSVFADRSYESGTSLRERCAKASPGIWVPVSVKYGSCNRKWEA